MRLALLSGLRGETKHLNGGFATITGPAEPNGRVPVRLDLEAGPGQVTPPEKTAQHRNWHAVIPPSAHRSLHPAAQAMSLRPEHLSLEAGELADAGLEALGNEDLQARARRPCRRLEPRGTAPCGRGSC